MMVQSTKLAFAFVLVVGCLLTSDKVNACLGRDQARMMLANLLSRYPDLLTNPVVLPGNQYGQLPNQNYQNPNNQYPNNQYPNQGNNQFPNQYSNNQYPNNQYPNNQNPNLNNQIPVGRR